MSRTSRILGPWRTHRRKDGPGRPRGLFVQLHVAGCCVRDVAGPVTMALRLGEDPTATFVVPGFGAGIVWRPGTEPPPAQIVPVPEDDVPAPSDPRVRRRMFRIDGTAAHLIVDEGPVERLAWGRRRWWAAPAPEDVVASLAAVCVATFLWGVVPAVAAVSRDLPSVAEASDRWEYLVGGEGADGLETDRRDADGPSRSNLPGPYARFGGLSATDAADRGPGATGGGDERAQLADADARPAGAGRGPEGDDTPMTAELVGISEIANLGDGVVQAASGLPAGSGRPTMPGAWRSDLALTDGTDVRFGSGDRGLLAGPVDDRARPHTGPRAELGDSGWRGVGPRTDARTDRSAGTPAAGTPHARRATGGAVHDEGRRLRPKNPLLADGPPPSGIGRGAGAGFGGRGRVLPRVRMLSSEMEVVWLPPSSGAADPARRDPNGRGAAHGPDGGAGGGWGAARRCLAWPSPERASVPGVQVAFVLAGDRTDRDLVRTLSEEVPAALRTLRARGDAATEIAVLDSSTAGTAAEEKVPFVADPEGVRRMLEIGDDGAMPPAAPEEAASALEQVAALPWRAEPGVRKVVVWVGPFPQGRTAAASAAELAARGVRLVAFVPGAPPERGGDAARALGFPGEGWVLPRSALGARDGDLRTWLEEMPVARVHCLAWKIPS